MIDVRARRKVRDNEEGRCEWRSIWEGADSDTDFSDLVILIADTLQNNQADSESENQKTVALQEVYHY